MLAILARGSQLSVKESLQPRSWLIGAVNAAITSEPIPMPLLLPNGLPILRLQITVTIRHLGATLWRFSFTLPFR